MEEPETRVGLDDIAAGVGVTWAQCDRGVATVDGTGELRVRLAALLPVVAALV
jgi:hypothetical protein